MTHDYSYYETLINPLSRKLYEEMIRREWQDADRTAAQLLDVVFEIRRIAISNQVRSGQGYLYEA